MSRWRRRRRWPKYVTVGEKKVKAQKHIESLRKKGRKIEPVIIEGRTISRTFWGKKWCAHFESFSDYHNRLPRGRSYARHGSICHLEIDTGKIQALVSGSGIYQIDINIKPISEDAWDEIKKKCASSIGSLIELLQGRMSDSVMQIITDHDTGLFPKFDEIRYTCDCPDWAVLCKHVAAVFYGIGNRFDTNPELLFKLRGVDPTELIDNSGAFAPSDSDSDEDVLDSAELSGIFGIDLDDNGVSSESDSPEKQTSTETPEKKDKSKVSAKQSKKSPGKTAAKKKTQKKTSRKSVPKKSPVKSATSKHKKQVIQGRKKKAAAKRPFKPTGQKILKLRKRLGMSRRVFAKTLGVTEATIYRWENIKGKVGMHDRNTKRLQQLAKDE